MDELAFLIEAERERLAQMLGGGSSKVVPHRAGPCSIASGGLTVHVFRRPGSDLIVSSVELSETPAHRMSLSNHLHTWMILRSRGEPWPAPSPAGGPARALSDELDRLSRALQFVRDEDTLTEVLLWEAGYRNGYLAWG